MLESDVLFVIYDSLLNIFWFWTVGGVFKDISLGCGKLCRAFFTNKKQIKLIRKLMS